MIKQAILNPLRRLAWRMLGPPPQGQSYVGPHGCVRCAASFLAWNQIDGDYLEFGTWEGDSFIEAYRSIWRARSDVKSFIRTEEIESWYQKRPRFIAFDSFSGLPPGEFERHADYEEGAYGCSEDGFLENVRNGGVDLRDVVTVPGFYDKTLNDETKRRVRIERAAAIMIDCDLYESTVPVLDFITDLVGQGTIIIFDDWYRYEGRPDKGEQRACNEWLEKNPQIELLKYWQQGPQSVAFMVNMRESRSDDKQ